MTYKHLPDISVHVALCKGVTDIDHEVARWHIDTFYVILLKTDNPKSSQ